MVLFRPQILYMASFLFTLLYVWNLYVGIREKFYGCSDGCALRVSDIFTFIFLSDVAHLLTPPTARAPPLSVCLSRSLNG